MQEPPGQPETIRRLAGTLGSIEQSAKQAAGIVSDSRKSASGIGDNGLTTLANKQSESLARALSNAGDQCGGVATCLRDLATKLEQLQGQAAALGPPPTGNDPAAWFAAQQRQEGVARLRTKGRQVRQQAATTIEKSAGATVVTEGYHEKALWEYPVSFLKGAWDAAAEMVTGVFDIVTHPIDFVKGIANLGVSLWQEPGETGSQLWKALVNTELLKEDPARWLGYTVVNVGSLFVGAGEVNAVLKGAKAGEAAKAMEVIDDVADAERATIAAGRAEKASAAAKGVNEAFPDEPKIAIPRVASSELGKLANVSPITKLPYLTEITHKGVTFTTDAQGRIVKATGELHSGVGGSMSDKVRKHIHALGIGGDQAGHIIAKRFGFPAEHFNLVPMNGNLNMGRYRQLEASWARILDPPPGVRAERVEVIIEPVYKEADSARPSSFTIDWRHTVNDEWTGSWTQELFENTSMKAGEQ